MTDGLPSDEVGDLRRAQAQLLALQSALERERRRADEWRRIAEERRLAAERLRQHPVVKVVLPVARRVLPAVGRLGDRAALSTRRTKRSLGRLRGIPHRIGADAREKELLLSVSRLPSVSVEDRRVVSIVILTRDGIANLKRLLPALRSRTLHPHVEVVIIDNGSEEATRSWLAGQQGVTVVRSETNLSYSAANNLGARHSSGQALCFLNDDTEPLAHGWLSRMLAALEQDVVAVGAQLVYPRQKLFSGRVRDITVQHRGVDLVPAGSGPPRAVNRGVGGRPEVLQPPFEVAAVTGACMLVDTAAFWEVGGFDERYHYGSEDVDLCWTLRESGGRVVVVPDAVLFHYEGATRHRDDPARLRRRQEANRTALSERYGPAMRRALELDRLTAALHLTSLPFHVAVMALGEADGEPESRGAELGIVRALESLGWRVSYVRGSSASDAQLAAGADAVVVLASTFDVRKLSDDVVRIAWVRGSSEKWLAQPWFDDYDVVLVPTSALEQYDDCDSPADQMPARQLREALLARNDAPRIALVTGVPHRDARVKWGDWQLALGMSRALRARSVVVTVHTMDSEDIRRARSADALVHLQGRGHVPPAEGQISVIWSISHPEELTPERCDAADLVLVASHTEFPADLRARTTTDVGVLLQATDAQRFTPRSPVPRYDHEVAFVGNSRFVRRPVVDDALAAGLQPAVYGANWERFLPAGLVVSEHIPNEQLPEVYSSVHILLNDHWEGMRVCGMASNRLFDALACGTVVISDELPGLEELFDGGVLTYRDVPDLRRKVQDVLADPEGYTRRAARGRAAVLAAHTFDHRAQELLDALLHRLAARNR